MPLNEKSKVHIKKLAFWICILFLGALGGMYTLEQMQKGELTNHLAKENSSTAAPPSLSSEASNMRSNILNNDKETKVTAARSSLSPDSTVHNANSGIPDETGDNAPPGSSMWFKDALIDATQDYIRFKETPSIPIVWDRTCENHPLVKFADLGLLTKQGLFVDPADYAGSGTLPLQFSQFWEESGLFYQISAIWDENDPQTFSIESYVAEDANMTKNVRVHPIPELQSPNGNQSVLLSQYLGYISAKIKRGKANNTQKIGGRVALFRAREQLIPNEQPSTFLVSLRNSAVVSVTGTGLTCQKSESNSKAFCTCPASGSNP